MKHLLKIEDCYYEAIISGEKTFEVRYNDRNYQKGDMIEFREVTYNRMRKGTWVISNVHNGYGLKECFVVLAIRDLKEGDHGKD